MSENLIIFGTTEGNIVVSQRERMEAIRENKQSNNRHAVYISFQHLPKEDEQYVFSAYKEIAEIEKRFDASSESPSTLVMELSPDVKNKNCYFVAIFGFRSQLGIYQLLQVTNKIKQDVPTFMDDLFFETQYQPSVRINPETGEISNRTSEDRFYTAAVCFSIKKFRTHITEQTNVVSKKRPMSAMFPPSL
jgi:hypothetical protein